jgi:hypothetical protein
MNFDKFQVSRSLEFRPPKVVRIRFLSWKIGKSLKSKVYIICCNIYKQISKFYIFVFKYKTEQTNFWATEHC